jgi:hypothetical protein
MPAYHCDLYGDDPTNGPLTTYRVAAETPAEARERVRRAAARDWNALPDEAFTIVVWDERRMATLDRP